MGCDHTITAGRDGERGSWCKSCGIKVYDVDARPCSGCAHYQRLHDGSICNRHLMAVSASMNVTFNIAAGSCFTPAPGVKKP